MFWIISERFGPICLMALVLILSRAMLQRGQRQRLRTEAQRLRCALSVILQGLRTLYAGNLELLARGEPRLISGRSQISLFRPQLGGLTSLEPTEIEAVLHACIAAERAETSMAVAGKTVGGAAFMITDRFSGRGALELALKQACTLLLTAEGLMTSGGAPAIARAFEDAAISPGDEAGYLPLAGSIAGR